MIKSLIKKYDGLPVTVKASAVYLLMSLVQKGLAFITSPIFVRMMSSEEYGNMSIFYTDAQLIGTVAMFCLSAGCFDVGMQEYKDDRFRFMFSILILSNVITILSGIILFITYPIFGGYLKVTRLLLVAMFIEFLLQPAFTYWTREERYIFKYRTPAIITIAGAVVSSAVSVITVYYFSNYRVEARTITAIIVMLPIYVYFWIYLAKKANFKIDFKYIKFAFLFNLPLIPHYLSSFVLNSSDRLMIANICGSSDAAYYSLAYNVAALVTIVWTAINSALVPYVFDKYEKKDYKSASNHVLPVLTVFAIVCLMIVMMAPEAIKILGTDEYYQAIYVIPPVVGGIFFQALYYLFTNILYYLKKPKIVMLASISAALLNILMNYIFISTFGFIAAGYTTLACFLLQAIFDYFVVKKMVGQDIYDMKYLSILSGVVIIISLLSNILYNYCVVRYLIILILLVILYFKRSVIINIKK